ncbi:MAG TPA: hypothetical protein PKX07_10515 [Aggregatilineales bacterium]|nr:hypothetical protein [Aggregatilineales bacterium]
MLRYLLLLILLLGAGLVAAQGDPVEFPTQATLGFDEPVTDTITDSAIFDVYEFSARQGDTIRAVMTASDGLAPLLGLRGTSGDIIVRSDIDANGTAADAPPNGTAIIEFELPEDGSYVLVPTRAGTDSGTTTGSYRLVLTLVEEGETDGRSTAYQPVRFRCGSSEYVTSMSLVFGEDYAQSTDYRLVVFGLDGFTPAVRLGNDAAARCLEATPLDSATLDLLGGAPVDAENDALIAYAYAIEVPQQQVFVAIGSLTPGRFVTVLEGSSIAPSGDQDGALVGIGPLDAAEGVLDVYMLRGPASRIDPQLGVAYSGQTPVICDDASYGECDTVPAAAGYALTLDAVTRLEGGRLDAGAQVQPADPRPVALILSSANRAQGAYWLLISGQLTAAPSAP